MSTKEEILSRYRRNMKVTGQYDMPDFGTLKGVEYDNPLAQFVAMSENVGSHVVDLSAGDDINSVIKSLYPEAKVFASSLPEITIADRNPDTVDRAQDLNGTDVGIVRGEIGVAENGCVWIPQTMKEKAVCFISEYLVILLSREQHASGIRAHTVYRLWLRLVHIRTVQDGRHRAGSCYGSAGCARRNRDTYRLKFCSLQYIN